MKPLSPMQLRCLRFLDSNGADGTGHAEWCMEYGDLGHRPHRLRYYTAERVLDSLVKRGLVDADDWGVTDAGREALREVTPAVPKEQAAFLLVRLAGAAQTDPTPEGRHFYRDLYRAGDRAFQRHYRSGAR